MHHLDADVLPGTRKHEAEPHYLLRFHLLKPEPRICMGIILQRLQAHLPNLQQAQMHNWSRQHQCVHWVVERCHARQFQTERLTIVPEWRTQTTQRT